LTAFDLAPQAPGDPRLVWGDLDQAARDAAYNNNNAVANSAALIEERNAAAAAARAARAGALDIPYAEGERTRFDLYPAADKAAPCLVFIHGGYWQRNSREVFAALADGALADGWSVAMPG
jgi:arylformamidase